MDEYEKLLNEGMANVNVSEVGSRYEVLGVEGHIAGTKTIISNFAQVATCLRRKPEHLTKFLLKELATSGEVVGDRLILTSKKSSNLINEKIKKYVDKFVLCKKCGKPDTELVREVGGLVREGGEIELRCLACGARRVVH